MNIVRSIQKMFKLSTNTQRTALYLFLFLLIVLAISLIFMGSRSLQEGLLTDSNIEKIKTILKTYSSSVDKICEKSVDKISKVSSMTAAEGVSIRPILADDTYTPTAKLDKINALKSSNKDIQKILAETNGEKYTATQIMLNDLNALNVTDDSLFTTLLQQNTTTPVISGEESTYANFKKYIDTIANLPA